MVTHIWNSLARTITGSSRQRTAHNSGFALVVTVSLLVLLSVIALGFLSLSAVTLRASTREQALAEARANARLALQVAIGELQKQMGPDQRISANGSILGESTVRHPHWMGSWASWEAGPTSDASPSGASDHRTIVGTTRTGMRPTYLERNKHFKKWIVSLDEASATNPLAPLNAAVLGEVMPPKGASAVRLVASGTLGPAADAGQHVHAGLLNSFTGRYAYWVGDESQKARITGDPYAGKSSLTAAERMFRQQAPGSTGTTTLPGLENIQDADQPALDSAVTLPTLDLVGNPANDVSQGFHHITTRSLGVLADVREGGLKRDLSTILERPIDPAEVFILSRTGNSDPNSVDSFLRATGMKPEGNDHLLYGFDQPFAVARRSSKPAIGQASVPIQDLAAYYQLYDSNRSGWRKGVEYGSPMMSQGIQVTSPDYGHVSGAAGENDKFLREYAAMYRNIVPVKIEYALGYIAVPRTAAEIAADLAGNPNANPPIPPNPDPDTHSLRVGVSPSVTMWNPSNVPLVFNHTDGKKFSHMIRCFPFRVEIQYVKNDADPATVPKRGIVSSFTNSVSGFDGDVFSMFFGSTRSLRFEPGEFKVFSMAFSSAESASIPTREYDFTGSSAAEVFNPAFEAIPGWNPNKYLLGRLSPAVLTFKSGDTIAARVHSDVYSTLPIHFYMMQQSRGTFTAGYPTAWHYRQYQVSSLYGGNGSGVLTKPFNLLAFPRGVSIIEIPKRSASNLIANINDPANNTDDDPEPFLYLGMKAATETAEGASQMAGMGRNLPGRPFLHSSSIFPQFVSSAGGAATNVLNTNDFYHHSWNCWIRGVNSVFDAASYVQISDGNSGYHGGGSSPENGTTHVVQQHLPLAPLISIAALSDAHLGGFSIATEPPAENWAALGHSPWGYDSYERVTSTGFAGLAPHMLQAIGNSYAHPMINPDAVSDSWRRLFLQGAWNQAAYPFPIVDHSYLANKALWDDYFFSSITPAPSGLDVFGGEARTVEETARGFLFEGKDLPNVRMTPYTADLDESAFTDLFATYSQFKGGFADKIAAHMMVEGGFNVNSTSVTAWKALFSSLRGKAVAYLDSAKAVAGTTDIETEAISGVPVAGGILPNGKPFTGSTSDPADWDQWNSWRELTDEEIDELAIAMVKQVRLRGPFLSLSEFINRRLDSSKRELSLKGALQAALDDPSVSINKGFRTAARTISASQAAVMSPKFPEALQGPAAYGSPAYVDQADILRNLAAQLSPRGDTFVIRTYGDSLDATGNVIARAWCEAVVQRLPEYIDGADEAHVKQADLTSRTNRLFGRKLSVISFKWLSEDEI
jgi:hypothetical protein